MNSKNAPAKAPRGMTNPVMVYDDEAWAEPKRVNSRRVPKVKQAAVEYIDGVMFMPSEVTQARYTFADVKAACAALGCVVPLIAEVTRYVAPFTLVELNHLVETQVSRAHLVRR